MGYITLCLKKGVQVAAMGAALTAGTMWLTGCSTGDDGNETEIGNNGGNGGNTGTETGDEYYGKPYTKNFGNGFNLYVAMGDNGSIRGSSEKQVATDTNHYLDKTQTYINGLINGFEQSLSNRPAAQNYFSKLTNGLKSNSYFHMNETYPGGQDLDLQVDRYATQYETYLVDMIKNLNTSSDGLNFEMAYRVLSNEAYKEGLGIAKTDSLQALEYQKQKEKVIADWNYYLPNSNINIQNAYQTNNFTAITNLLDQLIVQTTNNTNQRQNLNVTTSDFRKVVNLALTTDTLRGTHDHCATASVIQHNGCVMSTNFFGQIMYDAVEEKYAEEQNQAQGREY